jgi:hypothetical protein
MTWLIVTTLFAGASYWYVKKRRQRKAQTAHS